MEICLGPSEHRRRHATSSAWADEHRHSSPTRRSIKFAVVEGLRGVSVVQVMAPSLGVEVKPIGVQDAGEIERGIGALARISNAGHCLLKPRNTRRK